VVGPTDTDKPDAVTPALAATFGLDGGCVFTGLRTDLQVLYGLMDVFVLPSYREGFPRSPMEASAMGLPCVLTDIPGCREVVEHGRTGLLVPTGSPSALAGAIGMLLTHKDVAARMAVAGREKALASFDEQRVFAIVKAAYGRLLLEKGFAPASGAFRNSIAHLSRS
jgi:glycosyltransferase involved in cell wall biosynthesis